MIRAAVYAFLYRVLERLQLGEYITLDCRDGICAGCDTCAHHCHTP